MTTFKIKSLSKTNLFAFEHTHLYFKAELLTLKKERFTFNHFSTALLEVNNLLTLQVLRVTQLSTLIPELIWQVFNMKQLWEQVSVMECVFNKNVMAGPS